MNVQEKVCPQCSDHIKFYVQALIVDSRGRASYQCGTCGYRWSDEMKEEKQVMKNERKKINWDKPLRVKATGCSARVLCKDFKGIFGLMYVVAATNTQGNENTFYCKENDNRIENIPEKRTGWVNIHSSNITSSMVYKTREFADLYAETYRTARIKIEWEEGQFDE